jgi:hypothetical protein
MPQRARCDGTADPLRLAVGAMSRPGNAAHREGVRSSWASSSPSVLVCFLVGAQVKRTPRAPWDPRHAAEAAAPDGGPRGELTPLPLAAEVRREHALHGDVLMLAGSTEIHQVLCTHAPVHAPPPPPLQ